MNTIKCFSLLIIGSLLNGVVLAQNVKPTIAEELTLKPVTTKPLANNFPAPGTRIVAKEANVANKPPQLLKTGVVEAPIDAEVVAPSPLNRVDDVSVKNVQPEKLEARAIPSVDAMQAKMTEQQKATMAGKTIRPKSINQSTGATESKLTPITVKPLNAIEPVIAPIKEN